MRGPSVHESLSYTNHLFLWIRTRVRPVHSVYHIARAGKTVSGKIKCNLWLNPQAEKGRLCIGTAALCGIYGG